MTSIVIDASTAAKWQLSAEPEAERARDMLRDYAAGKITFVAPKVWHYEIANIFNKAVGTRRITEEEGREAFTLLQALANRLSRLAFPGRRLPASPDLSTERLRQPLFSRR